MLFIRIITFWGVWLLIGAAQAQTATFVASASATVNAASVTVGQPAGIAQDDILIAHITVKGARAVTPPGAAGDWTLVDATSTSGSAMTQAVFWRRVGAIGAEPASYTFSFSASDRANGAVSAYRNVDPLGSPLDVSGVRSANAAASITLPTLTTTRSNTLLVALLGSSRAGNNHGVPTGMTVERYEAGSGAGPNGIDASLDEQLQPSAGSTGAKTAAMSSATDYVAHLLALRSKPVLAHYAITVSSTTVATCDYVDVTITGHDATGNLAPPPANRTLSLSTSPATAVWQAGLVTGTGGWTPTGSTATYLWPGNQTSFTVRLRHYSAATLNINLSDFSGITEDASEDPSISFIGSAFRISDGAGGPLTIATQIAGKPSNVGFGAQTLYLQAIGTNNSGACGTLLPTNTDVTVEVGAVCNNPASCSRNVTLTSSALTGNTATFAPSGGFPATMNFRFTTANSEAAFALNYADAGQITLQFRVQIPGSSPTQYVQGSSNAFVARPFGLAFRGANAASPVSHGASENAALLAAAGDNFTMTLGAYTWASGQDANNDGIPDDTADITNTATNSLTPNFAWSTTVDIDPLGNLAGQPGAVTRASGATAIAAGEWSGGAATIGDWRYSEVGNVFLRATSADYLGDSVADVSGRSGFDGSGNANGYVGRFRPKHFALVSSATAPIRPSITTRSDLACSPASPFTYMDETFQLHFTLAAQNAQNAVTQNYAGPYAKLDPTSFAAWAFAAISGATKLTSRIDSGLAPSGSWASGVVDVAVTTAILRAAPDNPDGPYSSLQFGIAPSDGEASINTLDMDIDSPAGNDHKDIGLTTDVRFGRLRLDNALGAEARGLQVPMRVEYWNGSSFATNTLDDCTSIPRSAITLDFTPPSNLAACETMVQPDPVVFADGVAPLVLTAPGAGNAGSVVLAVNLGSAGGTFCNAVGAATSVAASVPLRYLLGRWNDADNPDGDANTAYDDKPSARAAFGLYGSQPGNFIFFRERY